MLSKILRTGMPVVYVIAGAMLLFTDVLSDIIVRYRSAIGCVLIGYGLLRIVLVVRKSLQENPSNPGS